MKVIDWLTSEEIKAIGDFKKGVSHGLGENLKRLRLFGSKARGDYERESDLDVLVLVSERSYKIDRQITDVSADVMEEIGGNRGEEIGGHFPYLS